jgi:hypothetical protein
MHARHPGGSFRHEPLVSDENLHPTLATVSVANADTKPTDTKPTDGHNPAQPAYPRRDRTAEGRSYPGSSASSLFGACVGDSVADRVLEALQAAENGLTRKQIRDLFQGNLSSCSIDQALEKLRSFGTATCRVTGAGQGRPATLWWVIGHEYREPMKEETLEETT